MSEIADSLHQPTASMIAQLTSLLQLQRESIFVTHSTTMFAAVSSCMLYNLLRIGLLLFPRSRFAAIAQPFFVCSAYAAVSTLAAALFPDRATPFIYTVFGLLSAGQMLNMFRDKLVIEDEDEEEEEGEASKFEVYRRRVLRFLKKICRGVAEFFQEQPIPPASII